MTTLTAEPRQRQVAATDRAVIVLFATTAFVGAGLLFLVQPMVARLLLPRYGGSATVWSTSSLFFQVVLLLGYLYTDRTTALLRHRAQRAVHVVVMLAPLLLLPLALPDDAAPPDGTSPVLWLLRTLLVVVGFPFLVLATTGPLVQKWYSWSGRHRARDPYFLFAASNLGSFAGLLAYPFLIEPLLRLDEQLRLWSLLFVVFVVLTGACVALPLRAATGAGAGTGAATGGPDTVGEAVPDPPAVAGADGGDDRLDALRVLRWTAWAFLPSGLMLAVTSHVSTDIAAIPLLWVVPLAIYLATFVVAFGRSGRTSPLTVTRVAVGVTFVAAVISLLPARVPVPAMVLLQMVMLALVAYAAHARLAADRPHTRHLTAFYLVVAVGGALGGLLNGVVAPLLFDRVLEYPLLVAGVPLLLLGLAGSTPGDEPDRARRRRTVLLGVAVALLLPVAVLAPLGARGGGSVVGVAVLVAVVAIGTVLPLYPRVVTVAVLAVMVVPILADSRGVVEHRRTFYGSYAVEQDDETRRLRHGTTLHGLQFLDERSAVPTTYYAPSGPLGDVFALPGLRDVGVVGLGVGTVAAYGDPGQRFTFYEIDEEIVEIARDPQLFTYLQDSGAEVRTVIGDGRLRIAEEPRASLDLVVLDAFSSDSIPVHLLTVEAFEEYAARLRPGGVLAVHISNRVFDLRPVLRGAADQLGWSAVVGERTSESPGATDSTWVVLAPDEAAVAPFRGEEGWSDLPARTVRWTDDFSSLLPVLRW